MSPAQFLIKSKQVTERNEPGLAAYFSKYSREGVSQGSLTPVQSLPHTYLRNIYNHSNERDLNENKHLTEFRLEVQPNMMHFTQVEDQYAPKPIEQIHFRLNQPG